MNVTETTRTFLEFFADRGHQVVPGSSLVPPGGGPVLFTTSGMHPLTPYLEGRPIRRAGGWPACNAACERPIWTRSAMTGT